MLRQGGDDVIIKVPLGTVVKDFETGSVIADMFEDGETKLIAGEGRGGKGNVGLIYTSPGHET